MTDLETNRRESEKADGTTHNKQNENCQHRFPYKGYNCFNKLQYWNGPSAVNSFKKILFSKVVSYSKNGAHFNAGVETRGRKKIKSNKILVA